VDAKTLLPQLLQLINFVVKRSFELKLNENLEKIQIFKKFFAGERQSMQFGIPMRWLDPGVHDSSTCYVCQNSAVVSLNRRRRKHFVYKGVPSALLPVPHSDAIPVPALPTRSPPKNVDATTNAYTQNQSSGEEYAPSQATAEPILMSQEHLNALVRKLDLSKNKAEMLAADLKSLNLLQPDVNITGFRSRQQGFMSYFSANDKNTFVYCNDIECLMAEMDVEYNADEWRIFIDSSKRSLKAVLLYYDNSKSPVPVAYSTDMKESYLSIKCILDVLKYGDHKWRVCCDLKVVGFLTGMQSGYVKHGCFLCNWDSRWSGNQYSRKDWVMRAEEEIGQLNIINPRLVPLDKILIPPLHIKLGVVKNFIKSIDAKGPALPYLKTLFPKLSEAKIKEGMRD